MGQARTYKLSNVLIAINGVPLSGFGETDAITFTPRSDIYESVTGADGEVTRSSTQDASHDIALVLMQTSPALVLIEGFYNLSKAGLPGDIFSIFVQDLVNRERVVCEQTWVQRGPDLAFGKAATEREWALVTSNLTQQRF